MVFPFGSWPVVGQDPLRTEDPDEILHSASYVLKAFLENGGQGKFLLGYPHLNGLVEPMIAAPIILFHRPNSDQADQFRFEEAGVGQSDATSGNRSVRFRS